MSEKFDKSRWAGKAAIAAGAAIGSAAIAAGLLYASRRKDKRTNPPKHPQMPDENEDG